MDTFFTVLSFPFWFIGGLFVVIGLCPWPNVTLNKRRVYGSTRFLVQAGIAMVGVMLLGVAWLMV